MGYAVAVFAAAACAPPLTAQQPPPPPAPAAPPPAEKPAPPKPFHYDAEGRRDPFVSLVSRGVETATPPPGRRIDGPAAMLVSEVTLKGIVQSRGGYVAMIQGPDTKTFMVRANDRLLDGVVKSITAQTLVMMQDVNDPLSLVKQREVRKVLRDPQEGK